MNLKTELETIREIEGLGNYSNQGNSRSQKKKKKKAQSYNPQKQKGKYIRKKKGRENGDLGITLWKSKVK